MSIDTKKYWLNTYFPYCRWKGICDSMEFAKFSLNQIILYSMDFWKDHQELALEYFKRPFEYFWWYDRYVKDPNFSGFTILELEISPRRQRKWFKEMPHMLPPVSVQTPISSQEED